MTKSKPLVTVNIATYNQANYIRQCLDGVVMQKTDFEIKVIAANEFTNKDSTIELSLFIRFKKL